MIGYETQDLDYPSADEDCPETRHSAVAEERGRISLLGLDFHDLDVAQATSRIAARPAGAPFRYVVTPNADHLVRISRDPALRSVYRNAALCLLDSRAVAGLARRLGLIVPSVAPGSDLTAHLLAQHLQPGERIAIVGLSPALLPALMTACGLVRPAHHNPPMGFERDPAAIEEIVAFIRTHPTRLIFLAVGSPRQEILAAAITAAGGATGTALCIGASLEFLADPRRRAPKIFRRSGLEWLFRFATHPRRLFRRYMIDSPVVIGLLMRQRLAARRTGREPRA